MLEISLSLCRHIPPCVLHCHCSMTILGTSPSSLCPSYCHLDVLADYTEVVSGSGYCSSGFYSKGAVGTSTGVQVDVSTPSACALICNEEPACTAFSWSTLFTCSRYSGACDSLYAYEGYTTYKGKPHTSRPTNQPTFGGKVLSFSTRGLPFRTTKIAFLMCFCPFPSSSTHPSTLFTIMLPCLRPFFSHSFLSLVPVCLPSFLSLLLALRSATNLYSSSAYYVANRGAD
jgi:hypothetical protein